MNNLYITTPIFYVNDSPHIGHAYTTIVADTIARFYKLSGKKVLFTTGTDEHGLKVEKAAKNKGKTPKDFVDIVSENFKNLSRSLKATNTDFIRTTEPRHEKAATFFWKKLCENNQIYKGKYHGWYSVKDESFYQEKELIKKGDKLTTIDGSEVEWIEEESYFFRLSEWQDKLLDIFEKQPDFILPKSRMNEVKSFVKSGLKDLSISRTSFQWGIKIPESTDHIMYVWIDALTNYLTSIGYPDMSEESKTYWKNCTHIIGKDILKFHAVYWPAMLLAIKYPIPKSIFAHGWWTNDGKKISKSLGNAIDPYEIIDKFGLDQFRYFLLREVPLGNDGDFSQDALINRINADLSNNFGNLVQRVIKFFKKNYHDSSLNIQTSNLNNSNEISYGYKLKHSIEKKMNEFQLHKCIEEIFTYIDQLNKFMDESEPWKTYKTNPDKAAKDLLVLIECFRILGIILQPFIPDAAKKLLDMLNIGENSRMFKNLSFDYSIIDNPKINEPTPLFPRYEK